MKPGRITALGRPCRAVALSLLLLAAGAQAKLPEFFRFSEDGGLLALGGMPAAGLYDESVLRTFELRFTQEDWQAQLAANYSTEVNVAADLIVDGVTYPGVGVRYKGTTSYRRNSLKNSFNIDLGFTDPQQDLMGYETLNLNNSSGDPSFVREVLANNIYRRYLPSPKANFVKLFINGQNWGVYVNVEQVNTDLIEEWFPSSRGDRWKINSTGGGTLPGGGLTADSAGIFQPGGFGPGGALPDSLRGQLGPGAGPDGFAGGGPGGFTRRDTLVSAEGDTSILVMVGGPGGGGGFSGGNGALTWLGADTTAYQSIYELQKSQSADPWGSLVQLCDLLNNTPAEALADSLDHILDIDRALWYIAGENILADTDGYNEKGGDYRIFYEEEMGRFHLLQYDANEVMGGGMMGAGPPAGQDSTQAGAGGAVADPTGAPPRQGPGRIGPNGNSTSRDPFENQDSANRPLISRLLAVPQLRQRYIAHYRTLLEESLDWAELGPLVQDYRALIEKEVEADPIRPSSYAQFQSEFAAIEAFVDKRREYLLSLPDFSRPAPAILAVDHPPLAAAKTAQQAGTGPRAGEPVQVRATLGAAVPVQSVLLYYSAGLSGAFSRIGMADDGMHGDGAAGDGVYGGKLPAFVAGTLVRYYIEARAADGEGTAAFSPAGAEHDTYVFQVAALNAASTPVVINELMAANSTVMDPQGEQEDWIELFNTVDQAVDLSGMYLSDTASNPRKWAFPAGTILAPGAYLVVWADEDGGDEPGLHASFKLSAAGEQVLLVDVDERGNQVLDRVDFGAQEEDQAYGRMPDGSGGFEVLGTPTPGAANLVPTAVLEEQVQPGRFALGQNYPNPFNSGTLIRFSLPADQARAELAIYNLAGQKVAILLSGPLPAGQHQFEWDGRDQAGRDLATGAYLYRLQAGSAVETRRLLLLR